MTGFTEPYDNSGCPRFGLRVVARDIAEVEFGMKKNDDTPDFYSPLDFPVDYAPKERPYTFINMVATIDGKIVTGNRGEPVEDLGSKIDHILMRRIQSAAEGVLIGAGAQRSSNKIWYPKELFRFVATRSGNVLTDSRFFSDAPDKAFIICPESAQVPMGIRTIRAGKTDVDWKAALAKIRKELGIKRLLIEGGSDINAQLLKLELVDELFLTIAPKIKLGADTPTYADGEALPRELVQKYKLIGEHRWLDEVFLRYRRS